MHEFVRGLSHDFMKRQINRPPLIAPIPIFEMIEVMENKIYNINEEKCILKHGQKIYNNDTGAQVWFYRAVGGDVLLIIQLESVENEK